MPRLQRLLTVTSAGLLVATGIALAQQTTVDINRISENGVGDKIGTIVLSEAKDGVSFKVAVTGLPKGQRGFHVHEKGDCGPAMKDGKMTPASPPATTTIPMPRNLTRVRRAMVTRATWQP